MTTYFYRTLQQKATVTTDEAIRFFGKKQRAYNELHYLTKKGFLQRAARGLYAVVPHEFAGRPFKPDRYAIASGLSDEYALSHHTALDLHGLAHSVFNRVVVTTVYPRTFPRFEFEGVEYICFSSKRLFGIEKISRSGVVLTVTDLERTLLDCIRRLDLAGGVEELLKSLQGIRNAGLLDEILRICIDENSWPDALKFRATFEDRRSEINDLLQLGCINLIGSRYTLTLPGLRACDSEQSRRDFENCKTVYEQLRKLYKREPSKEITPDRLAFMKVDALQAKRLLTYFHGAPIWSSLGNDSSGFVTSMKLTEKVLDLKTFEAVCDETLKRVRGPGGQTKSVSLDFEKLLKYLARFHETALYCRTGFVLEALKSPEDVLAKIEKKCRKGKNYFPPDLPKGKGKFVRRWNLIVPKDIEKALVF